jgi:hypothetical protein
MDKSWEGYRQFYELAFGSWIAYLFLLYIWKRLLKADHEGWKYALGGCPRMAQGNFSVRRSAL